MTALTLERQEYQAPAKESFHWLNMVFEITKLNDAMAQGKLKGKKDTLSRAFIENYSTRVLSLEKTNPQQEVFSLLMRVDAPRASAMPESVLEQPVVIAYVGKNKGVLNLDGTGAHYVLIDGNHRVAKAFFCDAQSLDVWILNQAQVRPYRRT
jgi:hypothetical protein